MMDSDPIAALVAVCFGVAVMLAGAYLFDVALRVSRMRRAQREITRLQRERNRPYEGGRL